MPFDLCPTSVNVLARKVGTGTTKLPWELPPSKHEATHAPRSLRAPKPTSPAYEDGKKPQRDDSGEHDSSIMKGTFPESGAARGEPGALPLLVG